MTEVIAQSANEIPATAVQAGAAQRIAERSNLRDQHGHRLVVANGYLPERQILTGIGTVPIKQPRIEGRRPADPRQMLDPSGAGRSI